MDHYESVGGKVLRCGYTTGTCATAASAAAITSLLMQEKTEEVNIGLPKDEDAVFEIVNNVFGKSFAQAGVIKDAGDDPDITDGLTILSLVELSETPGIRFHAGEGVGIVTKPGLPLDVGEPAINPIPREMMYSLLSNLARNLDYDLNKKGLEVTISIPGGEEIAEKTFNPRLGIKGGLSILGTTGIVHPMSVDAIIETQKMELRQKRAELLAFIFGSIGHAYARGLGISEEKLLKVSNYIGEMLDEAVILGVEKILIIGDLGKLVKLAGGIFRTHSRDSDARMEILAAHLAAMKADYDVIQQVLYAPTTLAAAKIIRENTLEDVYIDLVQEIKNRVERRVNHEIEVEVILFSNLEKLAETKGVQELLEELNV